MKTTNSRASMLAVAALVASGCVSSGKYDEAVAKTRITQAELDRRSASLAESSARLAAVNAKLAATSAQVEASNVQLETHRGEIERLEARIAELSSASQADRASSDATLATLRKRLDELKAAQTVAEARAALFRDVALRLKKQVDAGNLTIAIRDGRMVLQLPNDVLFDTGRTELKSGGQSALTAIASVLATMPSRHFQIAGHTDNVPIHNQRFPSNWELSSGRALRVLHFLIEQGVSPDMVSAAGYGEMDPIADNATVDGRRRNRRTEITLQPNIDELVRVP